MTQTLRLRLSLCLIGTAAGAAALTLAAGAARSTSIEGVRRARFLMGTVLEIDAAGPDSTALESAVARAFAAVAEVERRLSNWRADSEISRVNAALPRGPVILSAETFGSLARAFELASETGGAFDPTVGGVTGALGLTGREPDPGRASRLRGSIGWRRIRFDSAARTIASPVEGLEVDTGAFGKGEALDQALACLRRGGATAGRLNFGGQISVYGTATAEGRRFATIGVAAPDSQGHEIRRFRATDGSVSTSGDSEKPGHLIDPATGRAASFHGSVTVIDATGVRADALSTALFVMGPEAGLAFAEKNRIPALFVSRGARGWNLRSSADFPREEDR